MQLNTFGPAEMVLTYVVLNRLIYIVPTWMNNMGTVDNYLGPDILAGLNTLDLKYYRQPIFILHNCCKEVITVHGNKLRLFSFKI